MNILIFLLVVNVAAVIWLIYKWWSFNRKNKKCKHKWVQVYICLEVNGIKYPFIGTYCIECLYGVSELYKLLDIKHDFGSHNEMYFIDFLKNQKEIDKYIQKSVNDNFIDLI